MPSPIPFRRARAATVAAPTGASSPSSNDRISAIPPFNPTRHGRAGSVHSIYPPNSPPPFRSCSRLGGGLQSWIRQDRQLGSQDQPTHQPHGLRHVTECRHSSAPHPRGHHVNQMQNVNRNCLEGESESAGSQHITFAQPTAFGDFQLPYSLQYIDAINLSGSFDSQLEISDVQPKPLQTLDSSTSTNILTNTPLESGPNNQTVEATLAPAFEHTNTLFCSPFAMSAAACDAHGRPLAPQVRRVTAVPSVNTASNYSTALPSPASPANAPWVGGLAFLTSIPQDSFRPEGDIDSLSVGAPVDIGTFRTVATAADAADDRLGWLDLMAGPRLNTIATTSSANEVPDNLPVPLPLQLPESLSNADYDPAVNAWDIDPVSLFDLDIPVQQPLPQTSNGHGPISGDDLFNAMYFRDVMPSVGRNAFSTTTSLNGDMMNHHPMPFVSPVPAPGSAHGSIIGPRPHSPSLASIPSTPAQKSYKGFRIPNDKKQRLEAYFKLQPYPSSDQLYSLSIETGLHIDTVRNWFSNTRTRRMRSDKGHPTAATIASANAVVTSTPLTRPTSSASSVTRPLHLPADLVGSYSRVNSGPGSAAASVHTALSTPTFGPARPHATLVSNSSNAAPAVCSSVLRPSLTSPHSVVSPRASVSINAGSHSAIPTLTTGPPDDETDFLFMRRFLSTPLDEDPRAIRILTGSTPDMSRGSSTGMSLGPSSSRNRASFAPYSLQELNEPSNTGSSSTSSSYLSSKRASRRGRRRHLQPGPFSYVLDPIKVVRYLKKYYCTYCGRAFANRYEWNRHEESVHVPQKLWICCPKNKVDLDNRLARCPMCPVESPTTDHLASHNLFECAGKPPEHRTFTRRDHFIQHIQQTHRKDCKSREQLLHEIGDTPDAWIFPVSNQSIDVLNLICGFCGKQSPSWTERVSHIADHFRHGTDLSDWWLRRKKLSTDHPLTYQLSLTAGANQRPGVGSRHFNHSHNSNCRGGTVYRCRTCHVHFDSLDLARQNHPACDFYSCAHLPGLRSAMDENDPTQCLYCPWIALEVNDWTERLLHVTQAHQFRSCSQDMFFSAEAFATHLATEHLANFTPVDSQNNCTPVTDLSSVVKLEPTYEGGTGMEQLSEIRSVLDTIPLDSQGNTSGTTTPTMSMPPPRPMISQVDDQTPIRPRVKNRLQLLVRLCRQAIRPNFEAVDVSETSPLDAPLIFRTYSPQPSSATTQPRSFDKMSMFSHFNDKQTQSCNISSMSTPVYGPMMCSELSAVPLHDIDLANSTQTLTGASSTPVFGPQPFPGATPNASTNPSQPFGQFPQQSILSLNGSQDQGLASPPPYQQIQQNLIRSNQQALTQASRQQRQSRMMSMTMPPPPPYHAMHPPSDYTSPGSSAGPNSPRLGPFAPYAHGSSLLQQSLQNSNQNTQRFSQSGNSIHYDQSRNQFLRGNAVLNAIMLPNTAKERLLVPEFPSIEIEDQLREAVTQLFR